ncbi:MAG: nucleoside 2-deoxyribosyltransferase [Oligoflexia bacterium]|nr:nucleoside 2-deoxyribosyltransferase [Oligoflexia bacterium]
MLKLNSLLLLVSLFITSTIYATDVVYCSGPLFTPEERAVMKRISDTLERSGFKTFLPQRDGVEAFVQDMINSPLNSIFGGARDKVERAIFATDAYSIIARADAVIVNINGRVPDEGAMIEAGIAFSAGVPVVIYKNDIRTTFNGTDNAMVTYVSPYPKVNKFEDIPAAIRKAIHETTPIDRSRYFTEKTPAHIKKMLQLGKDTLDWIDRIKMNVRPGSEVDARELNELKQIIEKNK